MKRAVSTILLICFLLTSIGIVAIAEETTTYNSYIFTGNFEGAEDGDDITVFVLKEGYEMSDISTSAGSVMDKVYYTNMYDAGTNGAYTITVKLPQNLREATVVMACNGVTKEENLRDLLVNSGYIKVIYASPNGTDKDSGGTKEKPYSLSKAKSAAVNLAKDCDVDVLLFGGKYNYEDNRIQFSSVNKGTGHRITYRPASENDKPVITSMKAVDHQYITKVADGDILARVPEKARGMIYKLDMIGAGFAHNQEGTSGYTVLTMNYSSAGIEPPIIYLNGKKQMLSQYPNEDSVAFDNVNKVTGKNAEGYATLSYAQFTDQMDFGKWTNALDDAFIVGYLTLSYKPSVAKITDVDAENKLITLDAKSDLYYPNTSSSSAKYGPRVTIVNLPEEMDIPGEYYFNQTDKCIYYYAPYELTADDVFEMANDRWRGGYSYPQLVHITGSENITFEGIEFYGSRFDNIIYASGSSGIQFKNCTIHAGSEFGMTLSNGDILIENCNVYDVGGSGIVVAGAIPVGYDTSVGSKIVVRNNHVYNYAQNPTANTYTMGINLNNLSGSATIDGNSYKYKAFGCTIENNLVHASKFAGGVRIAGLNHTVARNELYNMMQSTEDAGAMYAGRSIVEFGNNFTENYLHDFYITENPRYSSMGIYWDDFMSGQTATRNIIVGPGTQYTKMLAVRTIGYDNEMKNNTFVSIYSGAGLSGRSPSNWTSQNSEWGLYNALLSNSYFPASSFERYDDMVAFRTRMEANGGAKMIHMARAINNLSVDTVKPVNISSSSDGRTYEYGSTNVYGNETGDMSIFVDPANQDYRVKKTAIKSGAYSEVPNEENFDMDWVGIQTKELMPESDKSFKLMHPTQGETLTNDNVILTWEKALFADEYEYVIATDKNFTNIVETGKTLNTFIVPTKTFVEGNTYYWKVTAINKSRNMGATWNCDKAQSFTVAKAVNVEIIANSVLSEDSTTSIWSLEGAKNFDYKYTVKNSGSKSQEYVVIAALYTEDGKFVQAKVSENSTVDAGKTATGTLKFANSTQLSGGHYIKVFVMNKTKRLDPISFFDEVLRKQ